MMKYSFSVVFFLMFFQLIGQSWPNNLIFTLAPTDGVTYKNNTLGFKIIEDKSGNIFIGKFKKPDQAEVAQERLANVGVFTKMYAFFRAEQITLEDAKILSANMNPQEETNMLGKSTLSNLPDDIIILKPLPIVKSNSDSEMDINNTTENSYYAGTNDSNTDSDTYFTVQLGVFSTSAKHKFNIEVNERVINKKYHCFYGRYFSIEEAKKQLITIKDLGYNDAFITGFSNGNKVSTKVVNDIINSL